jgi:drug/metabolite transporter (DMT)-like permease
LKGTDLSVFIFIRNLLGSVAFFCIALILYGPHHFMDAFSPSLWAVMFVYAAIVVVLGDLSWFKALATVSSARLSSWSTMTPVLGIFFAFVLLGEIPDVPQTVAAVVIVSGMLIAQIRTKDSTAAPHLMEKALAGA